MPSTVLEVCRDIWPYTEWNGSRLLCFWWFCGQYCLHLCLVSCQFSVFSNLVLCLWPDAFTLASGVYIPRVCTAIFFSACFWVSGCYMVWDERRSYLCVFYALYAICLLWDLFIYRCLFHRNCFMRVWVYLSFSSIAKFIAPGYKV